MRQILYELYYNYEHVKYILTFKNYLYKNVYSIHL